MLIEATLLGLAVLTWKKLGKKEEWTPAREEMYQSALEHLKGPAGVERLNQIAAECEKQGFHAKAYALRARAKLRSTDAATKKARHEAYLKGMSSTNVPVILKMAMGFEKISATGAAKNLRKHAENVQNGIDDTFATSQPTQTQQESPAPESPAPESPPARDKQPTLPEEAPQVEPAKAEASIPPVVEGKPKRRVSPKPFETVVEAQSELTNGVAHAEPLNEQESESVAEGP